MEGPKCQSACSPLVFNLVWLESFTGKVFFFFFVSLAIPWFGLLCRISSLRLSSGHSSPVLTLRTNDAAHTSLSSPNLLVVDTNIWAPSPLLAAVTRIFFGVFVVLCLCPTDSPVKGFPILWKLLFLHDSPPRTGLHPYIFCLCFHLLYFCPISFQRDWAAFLGAWCPLPGFRVCFVEVAWYSNDLYMNLWGRKWSPHSIPSPSWEPPLSRSVEQPMFFFVFLFLFYF